MTQFEDADGHVVVRGSYDWLPALGVGPCSEGMTMTREKLGISDFTIAYEVP